MDLNDIFDIINPQTAGEARSAVYASSSDEEGSTVGSGVAQGGTGGAGGDGSSSRVASNTKQRRAPAKRARSGRTTGAASLSSLSSDEGNNNNNGGNIAAQGSDDSSEIDVERSDDDNYGGHKHSGSAAVTTATTGLKDDDYDDDDHVGRKPRKQATTTRKRRAAAATGDEDSDSDYDTNVAKNKRKTGTKRIKDDDWNSVVEDDSDDEDEDEDEEEDDPEWREVRSWDPVTLTGNAQDAQMLAKLSELDREAIFAERKSKFERMQEAMVLRDRVRKIKREKREQNRKAAKKATPRGKMTDRERKAKSIDKIRRKRAAAAASVSSDSGEESLSEDEENEYADVGDGDYGLESKTSRRSARTKNIPSIVEICELQITQKELAQWIFASFFEDTVEGAFVRINIGQGLYRVAQIDEVIKVETPYRLDGQLVDKAAIMRIGSSTKDQLLDKVSNDAITREEYETWTEEAMRPDAPEVRERYVAEKRKQVEEARNHVWTEKELSAMLQLKRKLGMPVNLAAEMIKVKNMLSNVYMQLSRPGLDAEAHAALAKQERELQDTHDRYLAELQDRRRRSSVEITRGGGGSNGATSGADADISKTIFVLPSTEGSRRPAGYYSGRQQVLKRAQSVFREASTTQDSVLADESVVGWLVRQIGR